MDDPFINQQYQLIQFLFLKAPKSFAYPVYMLFFFYYSGIN